MDMLYKYQINNVTRIKAKKFFFIFSIIWFFCDKSFLLHINGHTDTLFHVEMLCYQSEKGEIDRKMIKIG